MNEYGDLSDYEFRNNYQCALSPIYRPLFNCTRKIYQRSKNLTLPQSVDWRSMGAVSSVKSQGYCCSSYAFGALGTLEGVHALASGKLVELSAQNIIDCSRVYGNRGCQKGSVEYSYYYIIDNNGVDTKRSYPYRGKQKACHFKQKNIGAKMRYFLQVEEGNEKDLEAAVAMQGPISVVVDASHNIFRFYKSGILNIPNCSSSKVTQALTLIGYGSNNGQKYWLVKNSWGKNWGLRGYALLSRGKNNVHDAS
uniref:Peptidase C1A papain C-terminal domain-containing protein n=1 Tax=Amphimedon queenslandica TaxID=400682 RepID=A0A1X7VRP3_AMPQE